MAENQGVTGFLRNLDLGNKKWLKDKIHEPFPINRSTKKRNQRCMWGPYAIPISGYKCIGRQSTGTATKDRLRTEV